MKNFDPIASDADEMHISSVVILAAPNSLSSLNDFLEQLASAEVYGGDESGKLVVVFETQSTRQIDEYVAQLQQFPDVFAVNMVFHQVVNTNQLDEVLQ